MLSKAKTASNKAGFKNAFKSVTVDHVHDFGNGRISFNAVFDDVIKIYNLTWVEGVKNGKEYKFISFPSRKGKDGNYYNDVFFEITSDIQDSIEAQIAGVIE